MFTVNVLLGCIGYLVMRNGLNFTRTAAVYLFLSLSVMVLIAILEPIY